MEIKDVKKIIESLLFVSDKPLLTREIKAIIKDELPEDIKVENILKEMQQEYIQLDRAFELKFVADGWTFATKSEYSVWIKKLLKERTVLKLSPSAMEVLAIIAYKQPITRAEIDVIRGVDCGGVIDTLTDRKFIKIVGRKETLGRPLLYGTTQEFLRHFGLSHLSELPVIDTVKDISPNQEEKAQELPFGSQEDQQVQEQTEQEQNSADTAEQTNQEEQQEQVEQVSEEIEDQQNQEQMDKEQAEQEQNSADTAEQNNQEEQQEQIEQEQIIEGINDQQNQEQTEQEQSEQEQISADTAEQNNQEEQQEQVEQISEEIEDQQVQEQMDKEQAEQEQNFADNTEQNNQEEQTEYKE